jgi:hypothetical protein
MRNLHNFAAREWLQLLPLQHALKQLRNDVWLAAYERRQPEELQAFLQQARAFEGRNVLISVAFEQPWVLGWQLRMARRHLADATVLVLDNSRRPQARQDIERVCREQGAPYLALPPNPTRHVNRSHGMAMAWIYRNVVQQVKPRLFGFIDHDLIPLAEMSMAERISGQPCFGMPVESRWAWQLWAGYCMFDLQAVSDLPLNFLYDFSNGLDTGGRNWRPLYARLDKQRLRFGHSTVEEVCDPVTGEAAALQIVDDRWLHIGGISYNDNFSSKEELSRRLAAAFDEGLDWAQVRARGQARRRSGQLVGAAPQ